VQRRISAAAVLALAVGCSGAHESELSEAARRGRDVYTSVCIACHNPNPTLEGSLGPAIAGSSRELIEWRVVRGAYPAGYTPKRDSHAMPAFPHLADQVDTLHAYLTECCRDGS
jgi:mono/diheme cytochrome c family protein